MPNDGWIAIGTAAYAFGTGLILFVLVAAAFFARSQLGSMEKSRELSLLIRLGERWDSPILRRARRIAVRAGKNLSRDLSRHRKRNSEEYYLLMALANFFEEMGILWKEGQVELDQLADRFRGNVLRYGRDYRQFICQLQAQSPTNFENFVRLADAMR